MGAMEAVRVARIFMRISNYGNDNNLPAFDVHSLCC